MALTHATPQAERPHLDRRALGVLSVLLLGVSVLVVMTALFLWPSTPDRQFDIGPLEAFAPGTVTSFRLIDGEPQKLDPRIAQAASREPGFHIVHLEDGELIALNWRSPHLGWAARWVPDLPAADWVPGMEGQPGGYDDGYSYWLMDGTRVFGPAPRDLDRFHVEITESGRVRVDTSRVVNGERAATAADPNATPTPAGVPPGSR